MIENQKITIVLDVDGVVANFSVVFFKAVRILTELNNWNDVDLSLLKIENIQTWLWDGIGLHNKHNRKDRVRSVFEYIEKVNLWEKEEPFPGAIDAVNKWHQMSIPVKYITQRTNEKQIQEWLLSRKLALSIEDIYITAKPSDKAGILKKITSDGNHVLFFDDYWPNIDTVIHANIGPKVNCYYVIQPWAREYGVSPDIKENMFKGAYTAIPNWDRTFRSIPSRVAEVLSGKVPGI